MGCELNRWWGGRLARRIAGKMVGMVPFGWRVVINAVGLWVVDGLWDSIRLMPPQESVLNAAIFYLALGVLLAAVNSIVKPVGKFVTSPSTSSPLGCSPW
jgi:uncharacterized membrane protein YvlD (DUF360 family)